MSIFLGLDISTSEVGICLLDSDSNILLLKSLNLNKALKLKTKDKKTTTDVLVKKAKVLDQEISTILNQFTVERIFIEDFMRAYSFGRTSKTTLIALAQFNGMSQMVLAMNHPEIPYGTIPVSTARKFVVGSIPKGTGQTQKEYVFEWILKNITDLPDKKNSRDMADAYVICKGGMESILKVWSQK